MDPNHLHHHKVKLPKAYSYAKCMEQGDVFPPVRVHIDQYGKWVVCDGAHRTFAAKLLGDKIWVDIISDYDTEKRTHPIPNTLPSNAHRKSR